MWSISPLPYQPKDDDLYTLSFPIHPLLEDMLLHHQNKTGMDDETVSMLINDAVMSTNLPLTTRALLDKWSLKSWLQLTPAGQKANSLLIRQIQIHVFSAIMKMSPERMVLPHRYGYVILTMDVGRFTLLSFPRYRYLEVVNTVTSLTANPNLMSIRGWKNVKLSRHAFVESLHATMFSSMSN